LAISGIDIDDLSIAKIKSLPEYFQLITLKGAQMTSKDVDKYFDDLISFQKMAVDSKDYAEQYLSKVMEDYSNSYKAKKIQEVLNSAAVVCYEELTHLTKEADEFRGILLSSKSDKYDKALSFIDSKKDFTLEQKSKLKTTIIKSQVNDYIEKKNFAKAEETVAKNEGIFGEETSLKLSANIFKKAKRTSEYEKILNKLVNYYASTTDKKDELAATVYELASSRITQYLSKADVLDVRNEQDSEKKAFISKAKAELNDCKGKIGESEWKILKFRVLLIDEKFDEAIAVANSIKGVSSVEFVHMANTEKISSLVKDSKNYDAVEYAKKCSGADYESYANAKIALKNGVYKKAKEYFAKYLGSLNVNNVSERKSVKEQIASLGVYAEIEKAGSSIDAAQKKAHLALARTIVKESGCDPIWKIRMNIKIETQAKQIEKLMGKLEIHGSFNNNTINNITLLAYRNTDVSHLTPEDYMRLRQRTSIKQ